MRTAPVKAISLPAVYRGNLECQSHVPFQHSRMRVIDSCTRVRRGFCTLVHSFVSSVYFGKLLYYAEGLHFSAVLSY